MKNYFFTDLAFEKNGKWNEPCIKITDHSYLHRNFSLQTDFSDRFVSPKIITIFTEKIWKIPYAEFDLLASRIGEELSCLLQNILPPDTRHPPSVLVIGIGNREITSDALGPETLRNLTVIGRFSKEEKRGWRVFAIAPGVSGETGLDALEIVRGVVRETSPDVILAVDALSAASGERLAATVQISDGGIVPGSGIGNIRKGFTKETLGIPVIALGIPTVIRSATLVADALTDCGMGHISDTLRKKLDHQMGYFVSPKESDLLLKSGALLLAAAIDTACLSVAGKG